MGHESHSCMLSRGLKLTRELFQRRFWRDCQCRAERQRGRTSCAILQSMMAALFTSRRLGKRLRALGHAANSGDGDLKAQGFDGEIGAIYVLQLFQRQGIGRALVSALSCDLGNRGFRGCALWVLQENVPARHFYEKYGGEVVGERKDVRGQVVLTEVAYGWRDIKVLQQCV